MKELILCGNGGLLKFVKTNVEADGKRKVRSVFDNIKAIASGNSVSFGNSITFGNHSVSQNNNTSNADITNNVNDSSNIENADILLAVSWHEIESWVRELKRAGARDIYRIPVFVMQYGLSFIADGKLDFRYCVRVSEDDSDLLYLETHVADTCNLKCRGCMHFSNIAIKPNYPDIVEFEKDFRRLSELFSNIFIIRLMGGEPLLNQKLGDYLEIVRRYFPMAELRIVTNGLLIPKQSEKLWEMVRRCHSAMDISPYPPTMDIIDQLTGKLDEEKIPYGTIGSRLQKFRKSLTLKPDQDPKKATRLCQSSHCHFLRSGRVAKCPLPLLIEDFNQAYGCEIHSKDIFNIYEEQSGTELRNKLEGYADLCHYCPEEESLTEWRRTNQDACMGDWIAEER